MSVVIDPEVAEVLAKFRELYADVASDQTYPVKRPLLAHYTSIATLEAIMANDEVWLSNPLLMNDLEEVRFGVLEGARLFRLHDGIKVAAGSQQRYAELLRAFEYVVEHFGVKAVLDVYVFCFSEHTRGDPDGLLSMWRGYGRNGEGVAIVFDTATLEPTDGSPLVLAPVVYASTNIRRAWINNKLDQFAALLKAAQLPDRYLFLAAHSLFERIVGAALFSKHQGFSEEKEWRLIYMKSHDLENRLSDFLSYAVGPSGISPKLKFKVGHIEGFTSETLSLEKLVHQIILGPAASGPLAVFALRRMLQRLGKETLGEKVVASSTPFRPTPS